MGDRLGIPGAVGFCLSLRLRSCGCFALLPSFFHAAPGEARSQHLLAPTPCASPALPVPLWRQGSALRFGGQRLPHPEGLPARARPASASPSRQPSSSPQPPSAPPPPTHAGTRGGLPAPARPCSPPLPALFPASGGLSPAKEIAVLRTGGPSPGDGRPPLPPGPDTHSWLALPPRGSPGGPAPQRRPPCLLARSRTLTSSESRAPRPPAVVSPPTRQRSWHQPGGRASRQTEKAVCARRAPSSSKAHTDRIIQAQKAHEQGTCPWDACLSGGIPGGAGSAVRCLKFPPPLAKPLGDSQPAGGVGRGRGACGAHCPLASAQRRPDNPPPRKLPLQHSLGASLRGRCVPACVSPPGSPSLCDPPARRAPMSRSAHAASYLRPSVSPSVPPPFLWPSVPANLPANLPAPTPPLPVSP